MPVARRFHRDGDSMSPCRRCPPSASTAGPPSAFIAALRDADVRQLLDVRQRRGVRGPEYAWANSARLQAALAEAGIEYRHHQELAPTTELRQLQYREDARLGVGKRSRAELAPEYRERYTQGDPRPRRPGADRRGDAGRRGLRAVLRRARPRGLPPLDRRRAPRRRVRGAGHAHPPQRRVRLSRSRAARPIGP